MSQPTKKLELLANLAAIKARQLAERQQAPVVPMKGEVLDSTTQHFFSPRDYIWSYKLDGYRGTIQGGKSYSPTGIAHPSRLLQQLAQDLPDGLDGEWVYGSPTAKDVHSLTKRACSSIEWPEDLDRELLNFWVFDYIMPHKPYSERLRVLETELADSLPMWAITLGQELVEALSYEGAKELFFSAVEQGYEGVVLRCPHAHNKHGRASASTGAFWKLKADGEYGHEAEAEVIGYRPLYSNQNEQESSAHGYSKRSTAQDGKVAQDLLGAWLVRDLKTGQEFYVGGGRNVTHRLRKEWWDSRDTYIGRVMTYRSMRVGEVDLPRSPKFYRWRESWDTTPY